MLFNVRMNVRGDFMDKFRRNERIGAIVKILSDNPNRIFTLGYFTDMFNAAKSTLSEDMVIVKKIMERFSFGVVETIPGAAGGAKFIPEVDDKQAKIFIKDICTKLMSPDRIIPGGFIYMTDIIYLPEYASKIGEILSTKFMDAGADYVLTIETKGIPIALNFRHARVWMSLSRRAIMKGTKSIFIDDFMKAGGTASGIIELMNEFENEVVGIGVLIETKEPEKKLVQNCISLLTLDSVDEENGTISINPSRLFI